jgi:hypothetical protein
VNVFRGLPALVTVIWVYFGLSEVFGFNFSVFQAGVIALTLLYSAFISEIYRAALLLGLLRGDGVIKLADSIIASDEEAAPAFVEIAATPATDVTSLRHALLNVCDDNQSESVVRRVLGLVARDLASGRRTFKDTRLVLRQMRHFLRLSPSLVDRLNAFAVDSYTAAESADEAIQVERRITEWLDQFRSDADPCRCASTRTDGLLNSSKRLPSHRSYDQEC